MTGNCRPDLGFRMLVQRLQMILYRKIFNNQLQLLKKKKKKR